MALGTMWLDVPLAVACLLVAVHYVGLLLARRAPFASAAPRAAMGVGMAAMFVPAFDPVPWPAWVAIFLLIGAWFGAAALRAGSLLGDPGHRTVGAVAMLFMLVGHGHGPTGPDAPVDPEHAGHTGAAAGSPGLLLTVVALGLAAWFIADVVHRLARPDRRRVLETARSDPGWLTATRLPNTAPRSLAAVAVPAPHVVMSAAMAIMLLGMA